MRFSRLPLLSAVALSFFAMTTLAADKSTLPNLSDAKSSQAAEKTSASGNADATSASGKNTAKASNTGSAKTTGPSPEATITGDGSAGATTGIIPTITGGGTATSGGGLPKGLPTLTGAFKVVPPSVPPTANAPFMRVSNLPEGTVFIVVGAILGFLAISVLLWRGLVAWSLHRSVKRAALQQNMSDTKALFRTPAAPFYQYKDRESSLSLGGLGGGRKKQSPRPTTAPGVAQNASLFFSPTAGAAGGGINQTGNRGSNYLPAGYYAAGAAQPGNGQGMAHIGQQPSISLSNLGPARDGYARAHSPPESPNIHAYGASSSTLNLSQVPGEQRAPSAYLDDLFDAEGGPPVPGHQHHQGGRF